MTLALAFVTTLSVAQTTAAPSERASVRSEADRRAKAAFKKLHFYTEHAGMHLTPGIINWAERALALGQARKLTDRYGLVAEDSRHVMGLFRVRDEKLKIGVLGCVACHSSRAAGELVIGLGNKNIDPYQIGKDAYDFQKTYQKLSRPVRSLFGRSQLERDLEKSALDFAKYLSEERLGNLSQGLVPVSFVRGWFYRVQGKPVPEMPRGQVKVPSLWGYGEKRLVGQFCDGFGDGTEVGWAVAVELAAGQTAEVVRGYRSKIEAAEDLFNDFLPPRYPFAIRRDLAAEGKAVFSRTCQHCHGSYETDAEGLPIFARPLFIPIDVVQTDGDRLAGNTPEFYAEIARSPLADLIRVQPNRNGYFAPRLVGIWSRFPYLHNGSVPTVRDLLRPPSERPKTFSLQDAGEKHRFDPENLGLTALAHADPGASKVRGIRNIYDTRRIGHSSQGHAFYTNFSDQEARAVIEYLKTL